jgi:uncharacterized protein (DUF2062 family)
MNRYWTWLVALLRQGSTPEKLALCVALGVTLGIFPILGSTTLLCFVAGWIGRLNQPLIHTINHTIFPLQVVLLIPFYRLGEWLFNAPHLPITINGVRVLIQSGIANAVHVLWETTLRAIAAWCLLAPVLAVVVYFVMVWILRKYAARGTAAPTGGTLGPGN